VYANVWHFLNDNGTQSEAWVVAIDRFTGAEKWRTVLPAPGYVVTISGKPAVGSGRVFAQMLTGELFKLDAATGAVLWKLDPDVPTDGSLQLSILTSPVIVGDLVISENSAGTLRGHRIDNNAPVWRLKYGSQFKGAMVVSERFIYGVDGRSLHVFDPAGRYLDAVVAPGREIEKLFPAAPAVVAGRVYITFNGGVWAFNELK
jgi:outer membrane protein assembly factor BamB